FSPQASERSPRCRDRAHPARTSPLPLRRLRPVADVALTLHRSRGGSPATVPVAPAARLPPSTPRQQAEPGRQATPTAAGLIPLGSLPAAEQPAETAVTTAPGRRLLTGRRGARA